MQIKILKNKKFHIPTDLIKEAEREAEEQEELTRKINNMTDEEYEVYINEKLEQFDKQIENGEFISQEEFDVQMKELEIEFKQLDREHKNYDSWKKNFKN